MPVGLALEDVLADPRIREIALGDQPAWVWDVGSAYVAFANAGGVALFNERALPPLRARAFGERDQLSQQIGRVAATLPEDGGARMAMLRLTGGPRPVPVACRCRRLAVDGRDLVLIVAVGARTELHPLNERLAMLFDAESAPVAATFGGGAHLCQSCRA